MTGCLIGLFLVRLEEKCSMTSQLDFFGAGVSAGEGEARGAAEGVLRPESSARAEVAAERNEAQRRPRSASCPPKLR
ncbi:unnamed protein product, partial [Iphiclides podalirius]